MKVRIDKRRSTIHAMNVTALTALLGPSHEKPAVPEASAPVPSFLAEGKRSPETHKTKAKRSGKPAQKRKQ